MMKRTEKENEQHNNTPLITEGRYYPHSLGLKFNWLISGVTKKKDRNLQQQQTPEEQQQQHILNINYLISLFNTARI